MFGPLPWIMQPSVRSAHCPPLDFLVSSVTITHLRFSAALTPALPRTTPHYPNTHTHTLPPPAPTLHCSEKTLAEGWTGLGGGYEKKNNTSELSFLLWDKSRRVFSSTAGSPQNFITVVTITVTTKIIFVIIFLLSKPSHKPPALINFSLGLRAVIRSRRRALPHQSPNLVQVKVNSAIYSREETSPSSHSIGSSDRRRRDIETTL